MSPTTKLGRLLVLGGASRFEQSDLIRELGERFDLVIASSLQEALDHLRGESFDAVLSGTGDFLPLERAAVTQQSTAVLNTIGQGVGIVDGQGRVLWQNRVLAGLGAQTQQLVCENAVKALNNFKLRKGDLPPVGSPGRTRRFSLDSDGRSYELIVSPLAEGPAGGQDAAPINQVAAVVLDVTASRRLQQKLNAIDQAGRELVRLEAESVAKLNMQERLQLLEEHILRYTRELLNFDNFGIWVLDKASNRLEMVLSDGFPTWVGDLELYALEEGNGITGHVAATGRSYICADTSKDPRYISGIRGGRSSLTVPLRLQDRTIGVLNVESAEAGYFSEDDRQFAEIFSRYIAIALNTLNLLVVERYTTTDRFVSNVAGEIAAPLADIVERASTLIEENVGHDALRSRLNEIIDRVTAIRRTVGQVAESPTSMLGRRQIEHAEHDPRMAGRRVLVADDSESIVRDICELLGKKGCITDVARDGAEATAMVRSRDYDLVLSDIRMPHASGYDIFVATRSRSADTPVILMTGFGYDPKHCIFKARQEGVFGVMFKPFQADELVARVREAFEKKSGK
ncbi:MAG: Chemotaxis response regulator protein-glutamate methylesterase [Phycisphaerae bacterium]|nr:Chemotaxis response regulator protein-glutamate methylesterase [Phycisphaerae bacterium]